MKTIRVIIIDPNKKEIREDHITPDLKTFYKIIGCEYIESALTGYFNDGNFVYVDEEGALKEDMKCFYIKGSAYRIYGIAVLLHFDGKGGEDSTKLSVDHIKSLVRFF